MIIKSKPKIRQEERKKEINNREIVSVSLELIVFVAVRDIQCDRKTFNNVHIK